MRASRCWKCCDALSNGLPLVEGVYLPKNTNHAFQFVSDIPPVYVRHDKEPMYLVEGQFEFSYATAYKFSN